MSLRSPFYDLPIDRDKQLPHIAHAAGASDADLCVFRSPCRALLKGVGWVPFSAVTGTDTDTVDILIMNRGTDGNGDTLIADVSFVAGTNAADLTMLTIFSVPADAAIQMSEGTAISCQFTQIANGLALPGGTFVFTYEPN